MKVESKETSNSTYTLTIEVPADVVSKKISALFRQVANDVNVPGFRRGKVPRPYLENMFGEDFLDNDVQSSLIEDHLGLALAQESMRPLSRPETRTVHYKEGEAFTFEADIEVLPKIEFPEFSGIKVEADPEPSPEDEDLERILDDLKTQHATLIPRDEDAEAALNDIVVVELPDGTPREIMLNEDNELADQLVGQTVGQTITVNVQEQDFELKLIEIKEMEKPDLEELASTMDKDSADDLVDEVKSQLQERLDFDHKQKTRYKVLDAIIEAADVPVPPRLKEEVIEHEINALARSGRVGALSDDDRSAYAEGAEERLKREVALESIKRQHEDLKLSDEDFETILNEAAEEQDINPTKFKALLERDNSLQRFRNQKEDERVLDYLVEQVDLSKPKATKSKAKAKAKSDDDAEKKPAKKTAAKSSAKKSTAKKTTAKKTTAKKPAAKKSTAKTKAADKDKEKESSE